MKPVCSLTCCGCVHSCLCCISSRLRIGVAIFFATHLFAFMLIPPVAILVKREALIFLKTHKATHLLQTPHDPQDSFLNRNPDGIRFFRPLYPETRFAAAPIRLYEIQYPPGHQSGSEVSWCRDEGINLTMSSSFPALF